MKSCIPGIMVALTPMLALAAMPASTPTEVSFAGQFRGTGPFPESGTAWWILTPVGDRLELMETRVDVQRVPDSCADFATRVTAADVPIPPAEIQNPRLMVRGSTVFRSGAVDTAFFGHRHIRPGEEVSFRLKDGERYGFVASGTAMPDSAVTNYAIHMTIGPTRQVIAEFPIIDTDGPPQLLWTGDLDRDARPDVLFDLTTSYAGGLYVLFLSSHATGEQLVREVGRFRVTGC